MSAAFAERCAQLDDALRTWAGSDAREAAVAATVRELGYTHDDVATRLDEVAATCSGDALAAMSRRELGADAPPAPPWEGDVVVLAAGGVPGLALEAALPLLAAGASVQVRPSRRDAVTAPFAELLALAAPDLASALRVVDDPEWDTAGAAAVHGSDLTVELVRERLANDAADHGGPPPPVAAYGSREGIAVLDEGAAAAITGLADALADDVLTFAQHGCMSPRHVLLPGALPPRVDAVATALDDAIVRRWDAHVATAMPDDDPYRARAAADHAALTGGAEQLVVRGPVELRVIGLPGERALRDWLAARQHLLQTAVLACADQTLATLWQQLLTDAGASRVCAPGRAQHPPADWPHDGIGRLAPLWGTPTPGT